MWRCTHSLLERAYHWLAQMSVRASQQINSSNIFFVLSCKKGEDLKWSRSRGMFWIFQDKEHFGLCFVVPEAFSLRDNEKAEMSSPHLVCLRPISVILGLCCFWIAFFFFPDAMFQLTVANQDQSCNTAAIHLLNSLKLDHCSSYC